MKNEMIKFVEKNFNVIKSQFLKDELEILNECFEGDIIELNYLTEFLNESMNNATSAEELIDVINERSLGVDLEDDDECGDLFNMIKNIKEAAK